MNRDIIHRSIIGIFVTLYFLVATISMINSVAFFDLAHNGIMSWVLAIGFELGAAASLAAIIILDRTSKVMVWGLFILLTLFQMMANSFHAYINLQDYMGWIELFGLERMSPIEQKRILSIISGAVLPVVSLGFIKSLVDYIRPNEAREVPLEPIAQDPQEHPGDLEEPLKEMQPAAEPLLESQPEPVQKIPVEHQPEIPVQPTPLPAATAPIASAPVPTKTAPAQPAQPAAKKMIPNNSGGQGGVFLRSGVKSAPVAGSPSR